MGAPWGLLRARRGLRKECKQNKKTRRFYARTFPEAWQEPRRKAETRMPGRGANTQTKTEPAEKRRQQTKNRPPGAW